MQYDLKAVKQIPIKDIAADLGLSFTGNACRCINPQNHKNGDRHPSMIFLTNANRWTCHLCYGQKSLSNIDLVMEVLKISFLEAVKYIGERHRISLTKATVRQAKYQQIPGKQSTSAYHPNDQHISLNPHTVHGMHQVPPDEWKKKAAYYSRLAHIYLNYSPKAEPNLAWLLEYRGLNTQTSRSLGFIPEGISWASGKAWGLPDVKPFYLPAGLCIYYGRNRIRIRNSDLNKSPRYYLLPGSSTEPAIVGSGDKVNIVIVESELDALLINQEAGDIIDTIALGTASIKPDDELTKILKSRSLLLISLDSDEAGIKASHWWLKHFSNAKRWPVIKGNDPTEQWKLGVPVRDWIEAGLMTHGTGNKKTFIHIKDSGVQSDSAGYNKMVKEWIDLTISEAKIIKDKRLSLSQLTEVKIIKDVFQGTIMK